MIMLRWLLQLLRGGPVQDGDLGRPGRSVLDSGDDRAPALLAMHDCSCAILQFFSIAHKGGLWLSRDDGIKVANCLALFVAGYSFLANYFVTRRQCRYHMEPSQHLLKHVKMRLQEPLDAGAPVIMNPAAWLCEQSEDWIGRISRITRRVHARTCGQRTLQRYLVKLHLEWEQLKV